jgi:hypothetical protein
VVAAFLQEILELGLSIGQTKASLTKGAGQSSVTQGSTALLTGRIRLGLKGISLQSWPDAVANFPGVEISLPSSP